MKPKFETVGQIRKGNTYIAYENQSAFDIAMELLGSHYTGMPVLDKEGRVIGVVTIQELIRALPGARKLEEIRVSEIMTRSPLVIDDDTTLEKAGQMLVEGTLPRLSVVHKGKLLGTITGHDLLRAWIGLPPEM